MNRRKFFGALASAMIGLSTCLPDLTPAPPKLTPEQLTELVRERYREAIEAYVRALELYFWGPPGPDAKVGLDFWLKQ